MANVQALLEVHSPHSGVSSQKEPPFSSISHLTQRLYWLADGFNKRNYLECLWALCEWGRSPLHLQPELYWKWTTDNWCQATVQCKKTKYKGRFSLFLNISNTAQKKKVVLKWQKTSIQSLFDLNHNLQTLREFTNGYCVLCGACRGLRWGIEAQPFRYQRH